MIFVLCVSGPLGCGEEVAGTPGTPATDGGSGGPDPTVVLPDAGGAEPDTTSTPNVPNTRVNDTGSVAPEPEPDAGSAPPPPNDSPSTPTDEETDPGSSPSDPGEAGAYGVDVLQENVAVGDTIITVDVYLPQGAEMGPTVLFLPGFQLTPDLYASYGQHLASWGYVTLIPAFPGSAFSPTPHSVLRDYTLDVLDWVATSPTVLAGQADPDNVALVGHSLGGKIGLLVSMQSPVVTAVFGVDPVDAVPPFQTQSAQYPSVTPEMMNQIGVPLGIVGETTNAGGGSFGMSCAPAEDNFEQYYAHAIVPVLAVEILGANHMSFLDNPDCGVPCMACTGGSDDSAITRFVTRRTMTAFFRRFLNGDDAYWGYLVGAEIQADVNAGLVAFEAKNGF